MTDYAANREALALFLEEKVTDEMYNHHNIGPLGDAAMTNSASPRCAMAWGQFLFKVADLCQVGALLDPLHDIDFKEGGYPGTSLYNAVFCDRRHNHTRQQAIDAIRAWVPPEWSVVDA